MSYTPYTRSATRSSGIVFYGERGGSDVLTSDSNFLLEDGAAGSIQAPNFKVADGGKIGSVSDPDAIAIASNGNVTVSQSLSITGDLTVNGTTTTVESTVVTIEDPVIVIGAQAGENGYGSTADDNKDRGVAFYYNNSGPTIGFFGHDDSTLGFTYIPSGTFDAASGVITGSPGWATFAGVSGDLAGNASTASELATARTITLDDELSGSVNFDGSANVTLSASLTSAAIDGLTEMTAGINATDDYIMIYDNGVGLKKINRSNFVSGLGAMSNFTISDGTTTQQVDDGETVTFADGTGAEFVVSATNTITVNSVDGEINHDALLNFVANEHIDHTSVTLTAGEGLSGGGDISTNRSFALDFSDLSSTDTAVGASDLVSIHDGAQKKITFANFEASLNHDNLTGFVGNEHIDHSTVSINPGDGLSGGGNITATRSLSVAAGSGIAVDSNGVHANLVSYTVQTTAANSATTTASRTYAIQLDSSDQLVVNVPWTDVNELTTEEVEDIVGGMVTGGTETLISVTYSDNGGSNGKLDFVVENDLSLYDNTTSAFITAADLTAGTLIDITSTTINVDLSEATEASIANGDYILFLDGGATGSASKESLADLTSLFAGNGLTATNSVLNVIGGDGITASANEIEVTVDNSTVELSATNGAGAVRVKDGGITFDKLAAAAVVTEGEGIDSNDNDVTVPTSAAVKDYVDNLTELTVVADSTSSSILSNEDVSLVDASSGAVTMTLPAHSSGRLVRVKKTDSSANSVTVTGATGNIDGASNVILYSQNESVTVVSNGTNWFII